MAGVDELNVKEGVEEETVEAVKSLAGAYKYGWETEIEMEYAPKGLTTDIVRLISEKNEEPEWMTEWRLEAFARWQKLVEPEWAMLDYPEIDFQDQYYYARPKSMEEKPNRLMMSIPSYWKHTRNSGFRLKEQMILAGVEGAEDAPAEGRKVAVDAVFDSVSVAQPSKLNLRKPV